MKENAIGHLVKTNPIQTQFKPIKANFKPNQTQSPKSQNEYKLNYNKGLQKKRGFHSPKKQTQFKPNFRKAQNERKLIFYRGL